MFEDAALLLRDLGLSFTFEAKKTAFIQILDDEPGAIHLKSGESIKPGRSNHIIALGNVISHDGKLPAELENRAAK
eukprot:12089603-Karenia_brevis.AAC.1